jgi:hypothetical protein
MTVAEWGALVERHKGKPMLLDSNLLVVVFIGLWRQDLVGKRATGDEYSMRDVEFLGGLLEEAKPWMLTPHLLTEVDNLLERVGESQAPNCRAFVGTLLERLTEVRPRAVKLVRADHFPRLGIADAAVLRVARRHGCLVVTSDHPLYLELVRGGQAAIYYPMVRQSLLLE